ncbi:uncharacterized protein VTP21DRAFT_7020 [Calcarisporiella thermophila]|uniref:uncharacterized protein n=1 Tax=Calcarisporiella thermophila TaxID=911321 RepID=UPI0037441BD6
MTPSSPSQDRVNKLDRMRSTLSSSLDFQDNSSVNRFNRSPSPVHAFSPSPDHQNTEVGGNRSSASYTFAPNMPRATSPILSSTQRVSPHAFSPSVSSLPRPPGTSSRRTPLSIYRASDILSPIAWNWSQVKDYNLSVHELPTMEQVLSEKTSSPLSIHDFSDFLRRKNAVANLEFLQALDRHESLWKTWRQQERKKRQLDKRKMESGLLSPSAHPSGSLDVAAKNLKQIEATPPMSFPSIAATMSRPSPQPSSPSLQILEVKGGNSLPLTTGQSPDFIDTDITKEYSLDVYEDEDFVNNYWKTAPESDCAQRFAAAAASVAAVLDLASEGHLITEQAVRKSAMAVYERYCSPYDPEKRVLLTEDHRLQLQDAIEYRGLVDPSVFSQAKQQVHQVLDVWFYPPFIDSACSTNMTRAMIFMGVAERELRAWGLPAILLGWLLVLSGLLEFFPLLTFFRSFETGGCNFHRINEKSVLKFHFRRAIFVTAVTLFATAVTILVFVFVPSRRLSRDHFG